MTARGKKSARRRAGENSSARCVASENGRMGPARVGISARASYSVRAGSATVRVRASRASPSARPWPCSPEEASMAEAAVWVGLLGLAWLVVSIVLPLVAMRRTAVFDVKLRNVEQDLDRVRSELATLRGTRVKDTAAAIPAQARVLEKA